MKGIKDNKGFSLVELIIVIAIIAILIGVMAPQYLKFVNNARVATDVTNAKEMATMVNAAIARSYGSAVDELIQGKGGTAVNNVPNLETLPMCKLNKDYEWKITSTRGGGVSQITLNDYVIYPQPEADGGYYKKYYQE